MREEMEIPVRQVESNLAIGEPEVSHGADIYRLISECKPLDLNSTYAYLLLCAHFSETCVRAESEGRTVGFISAYRPPRKPEVLFVWQVAVAEEMRGKGLAKTMLHELLQRSSSKGIRYLETTVSPSNKPSRRLFYGLARDYGSRLEETTLFSESDFGNESHEQEILFRIGPIEAS